MKYLTIFVACMMLDVIAPVSCQSEEYRKHRFDNWTTGEEDSSYTDSLDVDSLNIDTESAEGTSN